MAGAVAFARIMSDEASRRDYVALYTA